MCEKARKDNENLEIAYTCVKINYVPRVLTDAEDRLRLGKTKPPLCFSLALLYLCPIQK